MLEIYDYKAARRVFTVLHNKFCHAHVAKAEPPIFPGLRAGSRGLSVGHYLGRFDISQYWSFV